MLSTISIFCIDLKWFGIPLISNISLLLYLSPIWAVVDVVAVEDKMNLSAAWKMDGL